MFANLYEYIELYEGNKKIEFPKDSKFNQISKGFMQIIFNSFVNIYLKIKIYFLKLQYREDHRILSNLDLIII